MEYNGKKIAVLDTIHGGKTICRKLCEIGADAVAVDIYRSPPPLEYIDQFDLVVAPIHAGSPLVERVKLLKIPLLTHHQMVGEILRQSNVLKQKLVFEVTGVRGKTTVCSLLAEVNADKRLLLLSSEGLEIVEGGNCIAKERLSITPASMLTATDIVSDSGVTCDIFIFEVSLGGTGIADISIITTLLPEYLIASNSKSSTEAKLQMMSNAKKGSIMVAPINEVQAPSRGIHYNSFGMQGANVSYDENREIGESAKVVYDHLRKTDGTFSSGELNFSPTSHYDFKSYGDSVLCFITAALSANCDPKKIASTLSEFKGVEGRMSLRSVRERLLVDNSNSGLTPSLARCAIAVGLEFKNSRQRIVLIIGEEAYNICEGMNPEEVAAISLDNNLDVVILVGDRMYSKRRKVMRSTSLEAALRSSLDLTREGDIIISCVKKWR